jgi:hypothetical protein
MVTPVPPLMDRVLLICNSAEVSVTVVTPGAKLMASATPTSTIAWRKEPGPASFPFVTVILAASSVKLPDNNRQSIKAYLFLSFEDKKEVAKLKGVMRLLGLSPTKCAKKADHVHWVE